jgi:histidinol-phosphate aminotransferase
LAISPRPAVLAMAPYHPPTGNRAEKMRLDFNENTVGCSPRVIEFLRESLTREGLAVYPDYARVKRTLAGYFDVSSDELLLTNGTDEAIQVLVNTYVDDGCEVLTLRPSYAMYRFYAEVAAARVVEVDYLPPRLDFPLDALLAAIGPQTRAILVANPNNPTGTSIGFDAIERILKAAPHAAVLIDEAYYEFFGVTALDLIGTYPNLFVSRTFSKVFGMAAMRMGCLFSQPENIAYMHKAQSPYSVNSLAALAAEAAVQDPEYVSEYVAEALESRDLLTAGLEKLGIEYVPSSANFVLGYFGARAIEVRDALREKAILVRDRSYEIPGGVRITVGTREQAARVLEELGRIW